MTISHSCGPDSDYLTLITGDIWYYETIVLLASLLEQSQLSVLINAILKKPEDETNLAYRALLAAEALQSSRSRSNPALTHQVFQALKISMLDKTTTEPYKVECWQTLGRLQLGGIQLTGLEQMLDDESRFVREEALKIVASLSTDPLPECRPAARRLITSAAKNFSLDRLKQYRQWILSPPLRCASLSVTYVAAAIVSFLFWFIPWAISVFVASKYIGYSLFWWVAPIVASYLLIFQLFLWLNEDKRSLKKVIAAAKSFPARLRSGDRTERLLAKSFLCLWLIMNLLTVCVLGVGLWIRHQKRVREFELEAQRQAEKQKKERSEAAKLIPLSEIGYRKDDEKPTAFDEQFFGTVAYDYIVSVASELSTATDVKKFLLSKGLHSDRRQIDKLSSDPALQEQLSQQLYKFASYIDESAEIGYEVNKDSVTLLIERVVAGESDPAREIAFSLRREAREHGNFDHLSFAVRNKKKLENIEEYPEQVIADEWVFLTKKFGPHTYLHNLWVNGLLSTDDMSRSENAGDDEWLAKASRKLLLKIQETATNDAQPVPRESVLAGMKELEPGIGGNTDSHTDAERSAFVAFEQIRTKWLASMRAAEEARLLIEENRQKARAARFKALQYGALSLFVFFCALVLFLRYVLPRIRLSRLDASLSGNISELLSLACSSDRDLALRKAAIGKLANSDEERALEGILSIIQDPKSAEPIRTEANRAVYQIQRRNLRRVNAE